MERPFHPAVTNPLANVTKITLPVAYRKPGNVLEYTEVEFEIHQTSNYFRVVPLCDEGKMRLIGLPSGFSFEVMKGMVVMQKPDMTTVALDLIKKLSDTNQLLLP